ncbi:MAG: metallophosphoesterase [Lachnospiraceae bacterium]|nr:metallophosphoesterase [Lachnospiraceae bacterium]
MNYNTMVLMMLSLAALEGIYLMIFLNRLLRYYTGASKAITLSLAAGASLLIIYFSINIFSLPAMIVIHFIVVSLIVDLVYIIIKKTRGIKEGGTFEKIYHIGLIPIVIVAAILIYGKINMHHVVETDYTVYTEKTTEDLSIALISDIHYPVSTDGEKIAEIVAEINEKKPDVLLLGGDIVDERSSLEEVREVFRILGTAKTKYGVYYVYGNHDRGNYSVPDFTNEQLESAITDAGIKILLDESVELGDDVTLIGRNDRSYIRAELSELMKSVDKDDLIILLDHQPRGFDEDKNEGVDLLLSGHTHGGQMWPVGYIMTAMGSNELRYGYKKIDDFQVIVTSGLAGWGYDIKTGAPAEYLIVAVKNISEAETED